MRQRLAAGSQRGCRAQSLHPGGQHRVRDLQQDRYASRIVHRGPALVRIGFESLSRQLAGRSNRSLRRTGGSMDSYALRVRRGWQQQPGNAVLSVHRRVADRRSRLGRLVFLSVSNGPGGCRAAACRHVQRLWQVRNLDRLPLHGGQRFQRDDRILRGRRVWIVQPLRSVQRGGAHVVARLHQQPDRSVHDDSKQSQRKVGSRRARGDAELLRFRIADCVCFRSQEIHRGPQLRGRRYVGQCDERESGDLFAREHQQRAPTQYQQQARQSRRSLDAESAISEDRRRRVVMGRS